MIPDLSSTVPIIKKAIIFTTPSSARPGADARPDANEPYNTAPNNVYPTVMTIILTIEPANVLILYILRFLFFNPNIAHADRATNDLIIKVGIAHIA